MFFLEHGVFISAAECREMALLAAVQTLDELAPQLVATLRPRWSIIGRLYHVTIRGGRGWKLECRRNVPAIGSLRHVTRRDRRGERAGC